MNTLKICAILALVLAATACGSTDSNGGAGGSPSCSDDQLLAYDQTKSAVESGSSNEIQKVCHDDEALLVVDCHLDCSKQGPTINIFCAPDSDGDKSTNGETVHLTDMYHACGA